MWARRSPSARPATPPKSKSYRFTKREGGFSPSSFAFCDGMRDDSFGTSGSVSGQNCYAVGCGFPFRRAHCKTQSSKRFVMAVKKVLIRHSMCRNCWNKSWPGLSSVGHEVPPRFRVRDVCCFCLKEHKSGISVPKDKNDRSVKCTHTTSTHPYPSI